jgi:Family of unknown function (DUF6922)
MSVITKKIGKRKYAYLTVREGKKVVHKYLGPADNPEITKIIIEKKEASAIPERFSSLFWDTSIDKIHVNRNARYIIEKVLEFGSLESLEWLQRVYKTQKIIDVIHSSRNLTDKSRNFWKIWFKVANA